MDKIITIIYIDITNKILLYLENKYKKYINMIIIYIIEDKLIIY